MSGEGPASEPEVACPACGARFLAVDQPGGRTTTLLRPPDPAQLTWWAGAFARHERGDQALEEAILEGERRARASAPPPSLPRRLLGALAARLRRRLAPDPGPDPVTGEEPR